MQPTVFVALALGLLDAATATLSRAENSPTTIMAPYLPRQTPHVQARSQEPDGNEITNPHFNPGINIDLDSQPGRNLPVTKPYLDPTVNLNLDQRSKIHPEITNPHLDEHLNIDLDDNDEHAF